ncbi:MAG: hypothetical protein ABWY51_06790 [Gaiellaceae bacterium]
MRTRSRAAALLICLAAVAAGGASAGAAEGKDVLELRALTWHEGGDVRITVPAGEGGAAIGRFEHVQVRMTPPGAAEPTRVLNRKDVAAEQGVAGVPLGEVERGTKVEVQVHVREDDSPRTTILRGDAIARLRPDLVVAAVYAPEQTLSTRAVDVVADIEELNDETGATATLTLMLGPTVVAEPTTVTVAAGATRPVTFEGVKLDTAMTAKLTVGVKHASPFETDETNNARSLSIEVTENELVRANVLVDALGGYGAQFNQHVYAPVTNPPATSLPGMEAKVKALEPQLVRIFYNDDFEERQPNRVRNSASFIDTVQLAHDAGATINITYQAVNVAKTKPVEAMTTFAAVLEKLVKIDGYTNVRWVTVGNEPNSTELTMAQYEALNRALDAQLVARGLREQIRMMGGDLVSTSQRAWFAYIAANMNDVFDAYSVHIYWDYWNTSFFKETRLKDVRRIVTEELPAAARKPTYVMEFGVRGKSFAGKPNVESGHWDDGTDIARTNVAAFQQLWFDLAAAQLGFTGSVKWDAYWGRYHTNYNSLYSLIGPASEGWPLFPGYHATRLLLQTTARGWRVLQVGPWNEDDWKFGVIDNTEKELAAYAGDGGQLTLMGLDSRGRDLNTTSPESPEYSIGGLPADTTFNLALWNASGDGENSIAGTVTTNAAGVARFDVPLHAAFSLTTVPVS